MKMVKNNVPIVVGRTDDLRIAGIRALIPPQLLLEELPMDAAALATVTHARQAIHRVLHGADDRLLAVVGPCSIHDSKAALEYAARLKKAADHHAADLLLVMRVYFEKPRTTESQTHRQLASGLSCPVGFKNGTDGSIKVAVDALRAAAAPHAFMGMTKSGQAAIFETVGNEDCHVILRGGKAPNYDAANVESAATELAAAGLAPHLMIDFSHANASKQYRKQMEVGDDVASQLAKGEERVMGVMVESHLNEGRQDLVPGEALQYGVSITDPCLGWSDTESLLAVLAKGVRERRLAKRE